MRVLALLFALTLSAQAQWTIQTQATTADLRGIDSVGKGIAWASGTNGTVLRTEDGGYLWQKCTVPPGAEKLDFRGIQAFDANTAIVMSSGTGDLSRLYKTTDGCATWKLVFTNPDKDGFWDAIQFTDSNQGFILGDPVLTGKETRPHFFLVETDDDGKYWIDWHDAPMILAPPYKGSVFAASNSSLLIGNPYLMFVTGGDHPQLLQIAWGPFTGMICDCPQSTPSKPMIQSIHGQTNDPLPLATGESAGAFSLAAGDGGLMIVGGDYQKPNEADRTAVFLRGKQHFYELPKVPPHGYRSAVAYDASTKTWITVGPNGTDISTDDGRNWRALKPGPGDAPDADKNWNALSLPFVVGPKGRIGVLNTDALKAAK